MDAAFKARLREALYRRNEYEFCGMLPAGTDLAGDEDAAEFLFVAVELGLLRNAMHLLTLGAGLNFRGKYLNTPLHAAAETGNAAAVAWLLDQGMPVDAKNGFDFTPLHLAAGRSKFYADASHLPRFHAVITLLLDRGADIHAKARDNVMPICHATQDCVTLLLLRGANATSTRADGWTPLHGHWPGLTDPAVAEALIQHGADVNANQFENGLTPLHCTDDPLVVAVLLKHGAKIDVRDAKEWTPLHHRACSGNPEAVQLLLKNGADIAARNSDGNTPLHLASTKTAAALLENDPDLAAKNNAGRMPLLEAFSRWTADADAWEKPALKALAAFIEHKADLNARDAAGATLLHYIVEHAQKTELAELVLRHGAEPNAKDNQGRTPADLARSIPHRRAVLKLLTS